jgi:lysozyme family protein
MNNFDFAFNYVIGNEGKYSNDPGDAGGPTMYGIIQSEYSRWLKRPASIADMKALSLATAKDIYENWYWKPLHCDAVTSQAKSCAIFDQGVNRGIGWPPKRIQAICGVAQDGYIGPITLAALNTMDDNHFIREFEAVVEASYRSIVAAKPSQSVFLRGWLNRARRLLGLIK